MIDPLERAAEAERAARDEWLDEVRRQYADYAAGREIDNTRKHALALAWEEARRRLDALIPDNRDRVVLLPDQRHTSSEVVLDADRRQR